MRNLEVSFIFSQIADLLEIQGANPFRVRAYRRAALNIEGLADNIETLTANGTLRNVPGIGEDLANKIDEYIRTGRIEFHEQLKQRHRIGPARNRHTNALPGVNAESLAQHDPQRLHKLVPFQTHLLLGWFFRRHGSATYPSNAGEGGREVRLVGGACSSVECGTQQIHHQANRGLRRAPRGIAVRIYLHDVESNELPFGGNSFHQFVNFLKI